MRADTNIAIIGAGMAGLRLATQLKDAANVTVFEKSRGFGGRMSTRRAQGYSFDHGAQYFTARGSAFAAFLAPFEEAGVVAQWMPRLKRLGSNAAAPIWTAPRFVAQPGMNALCKAMAKDVSVHRETRVSQITRDGGSWVLNTEDGQSFSGFDWVLSAAPSVQTAQLMPELSGSWSDVKMLGCYSLMVGLPAGPALDWDAAVVDDSALAWIAANHTKPGRGSAMSLLCQADNTWADERIEHDQDHVRDVLLAELQRIAGVPVENADYVSLHRWRYAKPVVPAPSPYLMDADRGLGAAGDWCGAGKVEAAFDSGSALAEAVLAQIKG